MHRDTNLQFIIYTKYSWTIKKLNAHHYIITSQRFFMCDCGLIV